MLYLILEHNISNTSQIKLVTQTTLQKICKEAHMCTIKTKMQELNWDLSTDTFPV